MPDEKSHRLVPIKGASEMIFGSVPGYTGVSMPRFNQLRGDDRIAWFDKLPKKVRILPLLVFTLGAAVVEYLMGMHSVRAGKPIILGNHAISAVESFFWCAACLAISGGLFAVFMGWAKSSKKDPPE